MLVGDEDYKAKRSENTHLDIPRGSRDKICTKSQVTHSHIGNSEVWGAQAREIAKKSSHVLSP